MTSTAGKSRISQKGRRSVQTVFSTSPRLYGIRQDLSVAVADPVTPRRERSISLPKTNRSTRTKVEKLREHGKFSTTPHGLNYNNSFEAPDLVFSGLAPVEFEVYNEVIIACKENIDDVFNSDKSSGGKDHWLKLIFSSRNHIFRIWPKGCTYRWCRFYGLVGCMSTDAETFLVPQRWLKFYSGTEFTTIPSRPKDRIEFHALHSSSSIRPVDVQFSSMSTRRDMVSTAY